MLLLDTHAFIWLASNPKELSAAAKRAIQDHAAHLYFSSISALEIAILVKRQRLTLPMEPAAFIERALTHHGVHEIPVDKNVAMVSAALPDIHNDPFDRIIVATAQLNGLAIVSKDGLLRSYPEVKFCW